MNKRLQFVSSNRERHLWPLTQYRDIGYIHIAGSTLASAQMQAAPENVAPVIFDDSWVHPSDWALLVSHGEGAMLVSVDGMELAWLGYTKPDHEAPQILASDKSFQIRYPWDLLSLNEQIVSALQESSISGEVHPHAVIDGNVVLGEGSVLLPGVYIEGNVIIGDHCKIGPNCYIRGNTSIQDNCRIGNAVEVKNSLIASDSAIGHLSYIGDSVIGREVNIGAGTIVSNLRHDNSNQRAMIDEVLVDTGRRKLGAIIGTGVHTGINTSIYPGRKLGAKVTTLPGEVVKEDKQNIL